MNYTPYDAAKRELYEESGAIDFEIIPVFDYWVGDEDKFSNGMVFYGRIKELGDIPNSEMEEIGFFDSLPENLTYPKITPKLFEYLMENFEVLIQLK